VHARKWKFYAPTQVTALIRITKESIGEKLLDIDQLKGGDMIMKDILQK
jgi:hypothetical protein